MGIGSYFKAEKPQSKAETAPAGNNNALHQKTPSRTENRTAVPALEPALVHGADSELHPPTPRFSSRPQSISGRSARSTGSSLFLDDIKHEVMVNYLYQQQCAHLWVSDGSGEIEGVLLRKSRGQYMACPPQLGNSPFAVACAALNVQVGLFSFLSFCLWDVMLMMPVSSVP
jgi:hypothetical protein